MRVNPQTYLNTLGGVPDKEIDLAPAALCIAAVSGLYGERHLERYFHHLKILAEEVAARHEELLSAGGQDDIETQLAALKHILADKHGYSGDNENYDDLRNADLIAVIERAKGLPIALSILYIHAGRAQGWQIEGLNVPGHFAVRLEKGGRRLMFDPFNNAAIVEAAEMRAAVKKALGPEAELSATYFEATPNRDILIRLQNNIKSRQIETSDYTAALKTIETMRSIAPHEFRLLLDAGVLYSKTQQIDAAITALELYIEQTPNPRDRHDASLLLRQLREEVSF